MYRWSFRQRVRSHDRAARPATRSAAWGRRSARWAGAVACGISLALNLGPLAHAQAITPPVPAPPVAKPAMGPAPARVLPATAPHRPKIGLVLSGGGAMGIAHVGAILELERLGIRPDIVVGTSMGSIVGGLYASGMTGHELEQAIESMDWDQIFDASPPRDGLTYRQKTQQAEFPVKPSFGIERGRPQVPAGLVSDANLLLQLRRLIGTRAAVPSFNDLQIPFRAVATDIETGDKVVLDHGDLAESMRASMSVPGVFAPQHLNGKVLVDGGLADNIPIDVAREMGADIVIVFATEGPLIKAEDIRSLPQVLGQTVALLIGDNERRQLATIRPGDVLVKIHTAPLGAADFKKGKQLIAIGSAAAIAQQPELQHLAAYDRGAPQTMIAAEKPPPVIDYVRVDNTSRLSDKVLLRYVQPFVGHPLDANDIILALQKMRALGGFSRVDYRIENRGDQTGLVVEVEQTTGSVKRLTPGLTIAAAGKGHSSFDVSLEYRMLQLDPNGSEARFVGQIGDEKLLSAEWFKLFDQEQRWFFDPTVELHSRPIAIYNSNGFRLGEYNATYGLATLAFGRQFGTTAQFKFGLQAGGGTAKVSEGVLSPERVNVPTGQVFAQIGADTLDNAYFPTRGIRMSSQYTAGLTGLGEKANFQSVEAHGLYAYGFGKNALILDVDGGDAVQGALPLPSLFTLGGPFSFPGYSIDELTGDVYFAARLMYRRKLTNNAESLFGLPVYIGAMAVTGNTWTARSTVDFSNLRVGGNVFIAADTLVGPVFLTFGAADRGRQAFYLFMGKPF
jgi:NTE family protein